MTQRQEFEAWLAQHLNQTRSTDEWTPQRVHSHMTHDGNYGRRDWNLAYHAYCGGQIDGENKVRRHLKALAHKRKE